MTSSKEEWGLAFFKAFPTLFIGPCFFVYAQSFKPTHVDFQHLNCVTKSPQSTFESCPPYQGKFHLLLSEKDSLLNYQKAHRDLSSFKYIPTTYSGRCLTRGQIKSLVISPARKRARLIKNRFQQALKILVALHRRHYYLTPGAPYNQLLLEQQNTLVWHPGIFKYLRKFKDLPSAEKLEENIHSLGKSFQIHVPPLWTLSRQKSDISREVDQLWQDQEL